MVSIKETMNIHPRALVHPSARLGEGVVVGPDAIVDEHVELGAGCEVRARAVVTGHTVVGAGTQIGYGAVVGAEPQDLGYRGAVSFTRIGAGCILREYATVHRGTKEGTATEIGDRCYLMAGSHVAHNCRLADEVILVNNVLLAGYVDVGFKAFVGGAAVVHQFTRLGAYSMTRGQTRLGMDLPPYCMATHTNTISGINRVGLRRNGFDESRRRRILQAVGLLCASGLNRPQALEAIRRDDSLQHADIHLLVSFAESTKRGLCRWREGEAEED
jgi:UDP-N-acetylglucosamine acyltransferase